MFFGNQKVGKKYTNPQVIVAFASSRTVIIDISRHSTYLNFNEGKVLPFKKVTWFHGFVFLEVNMEVFQQDLILVGNLFVNSVAMNFFPVQLYGNIRHLTILSKVYQKI